MSTLLVFEWPLWLIYGKVFRIFSVFLAVIYLIAYLLSLIDWIWLLFDEDKS